MMSKKNKNTSNYYINLNLIINAKIRNKKNSIVLMLRIIKVIELYLY